MLFDSLDRTSARERQKEEARRQRARQSFHADGVMVIIPNADSQKKLHLELYASSLYSRAITNQTTKMLIVQFISCMLHKINF